MPRKQRQSAIAWSETVTDLRGLVVALGDRTVKARSVIVLEEDREAANGLGHPLITAADTYDLVTTAEREAENEGWGDEGTPTLRLTSLCGPQLRRGRSWQQTHRHDTEPSAAEQVDTAGAVAAMAAGCVRMMREHTAGMEVLRQTIAHREDKMTELLERLVDSRIAQVEAEADGVAALLEAAAEGEGGGLDLSALDKLNETLGNIGRLVGMEMPSLSPSAEPAPEPIPEPETA